MIELVRDGRREEFNNKERERALHRERKIIIRG